MLGPGERMTIKQFYDDDRRRQSDELTFGLDWTSATDSYAAYGLHWIRDTTEIYVLRGPRDTREPIFISEHAFEIILLGTAETEDVLAAAIDGWEAEMPKPDSLRWVRERLQQAANDS